MKNIKKQLEIKGIIFDLGGVLVGNTKKNFFVIKNISKVLKVSSLKLKMAIEQKNEALQKGKETSLDFWKKVCHELKIQYPSNYVLENLWTKFYINNPAAVPNRKMLILVKKLRKNYKVAILSNTNKEHSRINKKRGIFNNFDEVLLSNEVGLRKPEKQFFQEASKRLNIPFANLIFIDDELRWIKAARKIGIKSVQFKSREQLEKEFKKIGII